MVEFKEVLRTEFNLLHRREAGVAKILRQPIKQRGYSAEQNPPNRSQTCTGRGHAFALTRPNAV